MSDQHEPSTCRRILREFREEGLSIHLFNQAQKLREGVYRAEALSGLCGSSEMIEEDRFDWIDIILSAMLEEERAWRLSESIGIIAKSVDNWPNGRSKKTMMDGLISLVGGLPTGNERCEAIKSISNRIRPVQLPELLLLAIENQGMEAKAAKPVLKAIVSNRNQEMIEDIVPILTEAEPDLAVKFLNHLHHFTMKENISLNPSPLQLALPLLASAEFETVRTICMNATEHADIVALADILNGTDERAIRFAATLAGRADRAGDPVLARDLLEHAAKHIDSLDSNVGMKISKNLAKGFERLGDTERAKNLVPESPVHTEVEPLRNPTTIQRGHTMALVSTYEGAIGTPHLRALARASGIAWGFGLDIALVDWSTDDLSNLCERTRKESGTAGVNHLPQLLEENRIRLLTVDDVLQGVAGHPIATTNKPVGGSVDLSQFDGGLCLLIGLGRQGLPKGILTKCEDHFELTGVGASLETAVAMGAIAQRLADL
ncbi:MAG: DUF531 family protein [Candidatus Thermoplasmatota archaeon]|nr:DUF531 family protein [Candidatus Thermoplasmatota archaeon]